MLGNALQSLLWACSNLSCFLLKHSRIVSVFMDLRWWRTQQTEMCFRFHFPNYWRKQTCCGFCHARWVFTEIWLFILYHPLFWSISFNLSEKSLHNELNLNGKSLTFYAVNLFWIYLRGTDAIYCVRYILAMDRVLR